MFVSHSFFWAEYMCSPCPQIYEKCKCKTYLQPCAPSISIFLTLWSSQVHQVELGGSNILYSTSIFLEHTFITLHISTYSFSLMSTSNKYSTFNSCDFKESVASTSETGNAQTGGVQEETYKELCHDLILFPSVIFSTREALLCVRVRKTAKFISVVYSCG